MILKIQRYKYNQKFWLLDNIRKINVSDRLHYSTLDNEKFNEDISLLDFDLDKKCNCDGESSGCNKCKHYIVITCTLNNDSECSILFDTVAYVLNDNGKTIEKIIANYNR